MRIETLPSPGLLSNGIALQREAAKAISAIEILAGFTAGKATGAKALSDFFAAGVTALSTFLDVTVPTVVSRAIVKYRNDTNPAGNAGTAGQTKKVTVVIRHSEQLDNKFIPLPAAFTIAAPAKTITKVEIDGPDVILTVSVAFADVDTPTVAYTQPGATTNLRDLSGNLVVSYTAAAVTNPA